MVSHRPHSKTISAALAAAGLTLMSLVLTAAPLSVSLAQTLPAETLQLADAPAGPPPATNAPAASAPAAPKAPPKKTQLYDPLNGASVTTVVARATMGFMGLSGTAALLFFVYGGFQMITAAGNEKKYASGLNSLKWAVIGLFIIFGSYAILTALFNALGSAAS